MTIVEQIQQKLTQLPPDKQSEVLDFVTFLQQRVAPVQSAPPRRSLQTHPAFGSWRQRKIDALHYEQDLRAEWDAQT